ncbi:MAG TPA: hypothetical protein VNH65_07535 [Candidatus Acidoferrum sp.]|nr:hypothetical protein [Candidatus Acidoferrum sp.]
MQSLEGHPVSHVLLQVAFIVSGLTFIGHALLTGEPDGERSARGADVTVVLMRLGPNDRTLVAPGQLVRLGVGVNNFGGNQAAHSVVLKVRLPEGLNLQSSVPSPTKVDGATVVWNIGTLPAHAFPETFELGLLVKGNAPADLSVSADVTFAEQEQNLQNTSATLILVVRPPAANLVLQSTLNAVALTLSEPIKFGLSVRNQGNITAEGAVLTAALPAGVRLQSATPPVSTVGGAPSWNFGDIEPGATRVVTCTISLESGLPAPQPGMPASRNNSLKFAFDTTSNTAESDPSDNHLEISKNVQLGGADLGVWLDVSGTEVAGELRIGKDVTYSIIYGNFGNKAATGASVSLRLAKGLSVMQVDRAPSRQSNDNSGGDLLEWDVGDIRVGESRLINCRVHVNSVPTGGSLTKASISFPGTDINPSNNGASVRWHAPTASQQTAPQAPKHVLWRNILLILTLLLFLMAFVLLLWRRSRRRT